MDDVDGPSGKMASQQPLVPPVRPSEPVSRQLRVTWTMHGDAVQHVRFVNLRIGLPLLGEELQSPRNIRNRSENFDVLAGAQEGFANGSMKYPYDLITFGRITSYEEERPHASDSRKFDLPEVSARMAYRQQATPRTVT